VGFQIPGVRASDFACVAAISNRQAYFNPVQVKIFGID
jgi:hypothetical protein